MEIVVYFNMVDKSKKCLSGILLQIPRIPENNYGTRISKDIFGHNFKLSIIIYLIIYIFHWRIPLFG